MGKASTTIVQDMIRQVLIEAGKIVTDSGKVPDTFDFEKAPTNFKLKVFKKTLEEIIRKFEEHKDYQRLPPASLSAIKGGLIDTSNGFYALLSSRIHKDVKTKINDVLPFLMEAQAFAYDATTLLEEQGRRHDYYLALLNCRDRMFQIKLLLRTWKDPKDNT